MRYHPTPARLEAFSDGVIAVIITIMVLELKIPSVPGPAGLRTLAPTLAVYLLSFTFTGIYWVNHHHLIDRIKQVDHGILWTNLGFLFLLSLVPFLTNYMVVWHFDSFSVCLYSILLLLLALSFTVLQRCIGVHMLHADRLEPEHLAFQAAELRKGRLSLALYVIAIALAYVRPIYSLAAAVLVAIMWVVPTLGVVPPEHPPQTP